MLIITHNITKITEINISLCLPTELKKLSVEKYIQLYINRVYINAKVVKTLYLKKDMGT